MKKRIILGDPHGNYKAIEEIYKKESPDEVIVLGDYCDSFVHGSSEIRNAYRKLRKLQAKHGEGFITLLGNHDWHYIMYRQKYSGFKQSTWNAMHDTLDTDFHCGLLPVAFVDKLNKTIYSHAGLTKTWMSEWRVPAPEFVNECNYNGLDFSHISFDMYGDSKWQGPLWVRPGALINDFYGDGEWKQVVGHTRSRMGKPILLGLDKKLADNTDDAVLIVIDTLPFVYLRETIDNGIITKRELIDNTKFDIEKNIQ